MSHTIKQHNFLQQFTCIGSDCPDTCCHEWGMQIDQHHQDLYRDKAPELLEAVDTAQNLMKRDPITDQCVKFTGGLCGIQCKHGTSFLSDACHFYPRITRKMGDEILMTAALSCPEITRLVLFSEAPFATSTTTVDRLPINLLNPIPESLASAKAEKVIAQFLTMAADSTAKPETIMERLLSMACSFKYIKTAEWGEAVEFLLPHAEERLVPAESKESDPYCTLYSLALLVASAPKTKRERLHHTIRAMEKALDCQINWETREIVAGQSGFSTYPPLKQRWTQQAEAALAPILRRWIQAQLVMGAFPFGKFTNNMWDRMVILAVRFSTVKLALMCHVDENGTPPDAETVIRVVQSISRFLDHLADGELSMIIYKDAGLTSEARLRGLLNG